MTSDRPLLNHRNSHTTLTIQILFIGIVITTIVLAFALAGLHSFLPQSINTAANLLIEAASSEINPEPTERFVFVTLAAAVPIIALILAILSAPPATTEKLKKFTGDRRVAEFAPLIVAALLFVPFFKSNFLPTILGKYSDAARPNFAVVIMFAVAALFWCSSMATRPMRKSALPKNTSNAIVWFVLLSCALLQIFAWRLMGINSVDDSYPWYIHADAVIYSLSQVLAGETLLVDLPSQYGLWPEIVAPIFSFTGFSILGLTSFFAILQLLSLGSLFFVLSRLVKIPSLRLVGGIALVTITFGTYAFFAGMHDVYFQYWPIRFFWPALSVVVFYHFSRHKTVSRSALMSLTGAIGVLWNVDSGLFILVAYGAYLAAKLTIRILHRHRPAEFSNDSWVVKEYLFALAAHVGITVVIVASFFGLLTLKSGASLNLYWLFEYQKIFYNAGFMMLPLPREIHPWMAILGVYLLGLLLAFHSWMRNPAHSRMDTVFYLSMLGLGLFIYYQGRSHILNLASVCWPAVMLAIILADEYLRAIRAKLLPESVTYLPAVAVSLLLVACFSFLSHGKLMLTSAEKKFVSRDVPVAPYVANELEFIKQYAAHKHECLILSKRQGIYYAESGLASPLKGPGLVEILLKADQDHLVDQFLNSGIQCVFLGIGEHSSISYGLKLDELKILDKYLVAATNSSNTMRYLEPQP